MVLQTYSAGCSFTPPMVDAKGLEPLTSRTSSGSATSCAKRPYSISRPCDKGYYTTDSAKMQELF